MKKITIILILNSAFFILNSSFAQSLSPKVLATAGGYFTGGGNSLSWTLGETFNKTLQTSNLMLTQGEQQPYIFLKILNLKAFIEAFYRGGGQMQAVLNNNYPMSFPTNYCDSIFVELHGANSPYNFIISRSAFLLTDGTALVKFPTTIGNASYFIVLKHRNTIETWSKHAVPFNAANITFDFTVPE